MLKEERQRRILALLHDNGKIVASDLSEILDISEDTIRRDLREMDKAGMLLRVHGGALPRSTTPAAYAARAGHSNHSKDAIAMATVKRLRDGQVILMDSGTTVYAVVQYLPPDLRATVVTNSIPVMAALAQHPTVEVILLGGRLHKEPQVSLGAQTVAAIRAIRADVCILGTCAIHSEVGITGLNYEEAAVKQAIVEVSAEVIAVARGDKLETVAPYVVAPLSKLNTLMTEPKVSDEIQNLYRTRGINVVSE